MYTEDDLLPISALQHLLFCERQCALIHIEQLWAENRLTVEGRHLHDKAHSGPSESRHGVRIARGLPLRSFRLGLVGIADVVEFHAATPAQPVDATASQHPPPSPAGRAPPGTPFPVEYKRGRPKRGDYDRVQLCAQALCLEELLGVAVPRGALFYGLPRRREEVIFDPACRRLTEQTASRLHDFLRTGRTPPAVRLPRCRNCSLRHLCLPEATGGGRSAAGYVQRALRRLAETTNDEGLAP